MCIESAYTIASAICSFPVSICKDSLKVSNDFQELIKGIFFQIAKFVDKFYQALFDINNFTVSPKKKTDVDVLLDIFERAINSLKGCLNKDIRKMSKVEVNTKNAEERNQLERQKLANIRKNLEQKERKNISDSQVIQKCYADLQEREGQLLAAQRVLLAAQRILIEQLEKANQKFQERGEALTEANKSNEEKVQEEEKSEDVRGMSNLTLEEQIEARLCENVRNEYRRLQERQSQREKLSIEDALKKEINYLKNLSKSASEEILQALKRDVHYLEEKLEKILRQKQSDINFTSEKQIISEETALTWTTTTTTSASIFSKREVKTSNHDSDQEQQKQNTNHLRTQIEQMQNSVEYHQVRKLKKENANNQATIEELQRNLRISQNLEERNKKKTYNLERQQNQVIEQGKRFFDVINMMVKQMAEAKKEPLTKQEVAFIQKLFTEKETFKNFINDPNLLAPELYEKPALERILEDLKSFKEEKIKQFDFSTFSKVRLRDDRDDYLIIYRGEHTGGEPIMFSLLSMHSLATEWGTSYV